MNDSGWDDYVNDEPEDDLDPDACEEVADEFADSIERAFGTRFAGMWIAEENGRRRLVVAVKEAGPNDVEHLHRIVGGPNQNLVDLVKVKYSVVELMDCRETVSRIIEELPKEERDLFSGLHLSPLENCVTLHLTRAQAKLLDALRKAVPEGALTIKEGQWVGYAPLTKSALENQDSFD